MKSDGTHVGWWHCLMHRLGLTAGYVDHERDSAGIWWIGLRCPKCGKLTDPMLSNYQDRLSSDENGQALNRKEAQP